MLSAFDGYFRGKPKFDKLVMKIVPEPQTMALMFKKGDLDVTFNIKRETPTTSKVEVTARENLAEWDKKYAEQLLNEVVAKK